MLVRQAVKVCGIDGIALTKLDVLDGFEELKVCVGYKLDGERIDHLPAGTMRAGRARAGLRDARRLDDSRRAARAPGPSCRRQAIKYVRRIEELIECPGDAALDQPERDDTILVRDPFAD